MSRKEESRKIKTEIPRALHMAIIKLQAAEDLDYDQACLRVSELVDENGEKFKSAVEAEANRLQKSKFMSMVNKSKKSWRENGYDAGFDYVCDMDGAKIFRKPK